MQKNSIISPAYKQVKLKDVKDLIKDMDSIYILHFIIIKKDGNVQVVNFLPHTN